MNRIVKECLKKYAGGECFFHELDDNIKFNKRILKKILGLVDSDSVLILIGEFGRQMISLIRQPKYAHQYILLDGSPRKGQQVYVEESNFRKSNYDRPIIFIDDSYFSGNTFQYCKGFIKGKYNLNIDRVVVAYNGSHYKKDYVTGLYDYIESHAVRGMS